MSNWIKKISNGTKSQKVNPVRNIDFPRRKQISNGVKITVKDFQKKTPINPKRIKRTILKVLSLEGKKFSGQITICFVSDPKIKELNFKYRRKNRPTDVLVFDLLDQRQSNRISADIVISTDTAIRNAHLFMTRPLYELSLYVVHGILHLLGYDDQTRKQRQLMRQKEKEYVTLLDK